MEITTHADAWSFLQKTQADLESNEAANSLMLGICLRLVRHPERITTPPFLKTVEDSNGLVLAAMMTPPHKIVIYGHQGDLDEGARILASDLIDGGWDVPGVLGPATTARLFAKNWAKLTGKPNKHRGQHKVYQIEKVKSSIPQNGQLRLAKMADLELVTKWRCAFQISIFGQADQNAEKQAAERAITAGDIYLWIDKDPVSMALKTRPTQNGISISLVYTPPEMRGRGYATACVGELSRQLLSSGWKFCALFADVNNVAAIKTYLKIGFEPVCNYTEFDFMA